MKRTRFGILALVGAALLSAGCARLGLDPWPNDREAGGMEHGLDPFPEAMHPGETQNVGLDPFPAAVHPGRSNDVGLDPFPKDAVAREDGKFGLDPFPAPMHPGGRQDVGLNPFPSKPRKAGAAAPVAASASTKTVHTDVPDSDEYPGAPPVILPGTPERKEESGPVKKKKRPAWKDE